MTTRLPQTLVLALVLLVSRPADAIEPIGVQLHPAKVSIGLLYGGANVRVTARTPKGCSVAMLITGAATDLHLNKIGKKAGLLWMNAGGLRYRKVPSIYFVSSTGPLRELATKNELERLSVGYEALAQRITGGQDRDARKYFAELVKLKERDGLFSAAEHGVVLRPSGAADTQIATASFHLPPKASPGRYDVQVLCFRSRKLAVQGRAQLVLSFDRNVAFLSMLSRDHGLLYGILAVLIAIIAGLFTGFIFGRKGGAH